MRTHAARAALSLSAVFLLLDITKVGGSVIGETRGDEEERNKDTAAGTDQYSRLICSPPHTGFTEPLGLTVFSKESVSLLE